MIVWLWSGFVLLVLGFLALDLGVFHRRAHVVGLREALAWTGVWVAVSLAFAALIHLLYDRHLFGLGLDPSWPLDGRTAMLQYLTGYVVEKSLSLDNIFVIAMIFEYFRVPLSYQHRVLFWGILGALVLRGVMIAAGTVLIHRFDWIVYVFGAFLLATAFRMLRVEPAPPDPERNLLVRLTRRFYPVSPVYDGQRFFTRVGGRRAVTPLMLALLLVESSDVLFAVDSIPAVFAITHDPFLVLTSNVFAILGLRSLFFALASALERFPHLKTSLVLVLGFVGVKMLLSNHLHITAAVSLPVILVMLGGGMVASWRAGRRRVEGA
ncbi:TerC family protein [bacterium]|nr:TerC family protein [bacterium]